MGNSEWVISDPLPSKSYNTGDFADLCDLVSLAIVSISKRAVWKIWKFEHQALDFFVIYSQTDKANLNLEAQLYDYIGIASLPKMSPILYAKLSTLTN